MSNMLLPSGHHEFVEENVATRDAIEDVRRGIGAIESIFSGLQLPAGMEGAGHQELPGVANYAVFLQLVGHGLGAGAFRKIENQRPAKALVRGVERQIRYCRGNKRQQTKNKQETLHDWRESRKLSSRITAASRSTALARFSMLMPLSRSTRWACTVVRRSSHN